MVGDEDSIQHETTSFLVGLGWREISRRDMNALRAGRLGETIVERLFLDAVQRINVGLSEQDAIQVLSLVKTSIDNETFLLALRDGIAVKLSSDAPARTVRLLDLDDRLANDFVVSREFVLETGAVRQPRLDQACLVNGMLLVLGENKAGHVPWTDGAEDFVGYWRDAPDLARLSAFAFVTNGLDFRVAPSGAAEIADWAEWNDPWPATVEDDENAFEIGLTGVLSPTSVVDLVAHFIIFEQRDGRVTKKLARYQQFRAANKIVDRVLDGALRSGLIWHTQGSGKSLTMVLAARKLQHVGLRRPTVFIVVDRNDLDEQISGTLAACSFEGVVNATSRSHLSALIANDTRGVVVTTVQKFAAEIASIADRENVIVFVDEAHRSHYNTFGIRMRAALKNAWLFGFTGTPLETNDRSTRTWFSPEIDGRREAYLDVYGISQAVADGATVPIRYQLRSQEWSFNGQLVEEEYQRIAGHLENEERDQVSAAAVRFAVVQKSPARVKALASNFADFVEDHVAPRGLKAMFVAQDREGCAKIADELRGVLAANAFAVVYTVSKDDAQKPYADSLRRWYAKAQVARLGTVAMATPADHAVASEATDVDDDLVDAGEVAARKDLVRRFKDEADPLRVLIVCDMLLTGFDAPPCGVIAIDKHLRSHRLLQAIARANRPYSEKDYGLILDYYGVFEDLNNALAEFDPKDVEDVLLPVEELVEQFPVALEGTLAMLNGMPSDQGQSRQMRWLVQHLEDAERGEEFESRYRHVEALFEALAPDPALAPYLDRYKELIRLRAIWRHGARLETPGTPTTVRLIRPQTEALISTSIVMDRLRDDLPIYEVDGSYLRKLEGEALSPEEKSAEIESTLVHEARLRGENDPLGQSLSQRLELLRARRKGHDEHQLELLADYEHLVVDWIGERDGAGDTGLSERAFSIYTLARAAVAAAEDADDEALKALAAYIDELIGQRAFPGWQRSEGTIKEIMREVIVALVSSRSEFSRLALYPGTTFVDELENHLPHSP
jgi:type I restriction enzyme, R subunit